MSESRGALAVALLCSCLLIVPASEGQEQKPLTVFDAVVGESGQKSPEISTAEVTRLLREGKTLVLDARPFREFAISHIPGALNVSAKPGVAMSLYVSDVAEIERLVRGRKDTTLVLIIGLFDLLGIVQAVVSDPQWIGYNVEGYVFAGLGFWIFCFALSRYSQLLERRLAPTPRHATEHHHK